MSESEVTILEKVQKLLRLQHGAEAIGSLHEAELAAQKAQDLLLKYNLELADVTGFVKPDANDIRRFDETGIVNPKNEGKWIHSLFSVLCRHNFCRLIVRTSKYMDDYAILIGTKDNVEVVKFLADQLSNRIRIAEKNAWKANTSDEKRNAFRRGFFLGAVRGIDQQLELKRLADIQANVKVTTLVHVQDNKIKEFIQKEFDNLSKGRSSRVSATNGYAMGKETGRSMNINRGVQGNNVNNKRLN